MKVKLCGKDFLVVKHTEYREYVATCPVDSAGELSKHYFYNSMLNVHDSTSEYLSKIPEGVKSEMKKIGYNHEPVKEMPIQVIQYMVEHADLFNHLF